MESERYTRLVAIPLFGCAVLLLAASGCLGNSCPCGADRADPIERHDLSFPWEHELLREHELENSDAARDVAERP